MEPAELDRGSPRPTPTPADRGPFGRAGQAEIVEMVANEPARAGRRSGPSRRIQGGGRAEGEKMSSVAVQRYARITSRSRGNRGSRFRPGMKGRIIAARRNIRAFEGHGDRRHHRRHPGGVILSGFNRSAGDRPHFLSRLVQDGRIHPARIEETVVKVTKEVDETIREAGEQALFDLGIHGVHAELVSWSGTEVPHFLRPNIYTHSLEVASSAG